VAEVSIISRVSGQKGGGKKKNSSPRETRDHGGATSLFFFFSSFFLRFSAWAPGQSRGARNTYPTEKQPYLEYVSRYIDIYSRYMRPTAPRLVQVRIPSAASPPCVVRDAAALNGREACEKVCRYIRFSIFSVWRAPHSYRYCMRVQSGTVFVIHHFLSPTALPREGHIRQIHMYVLVQTH